MGSFDVVTKRKTLPLLGIELLSSRPKTVYLICIKVNASLFFKNCVNSLCIDLSVLVVVGVIRLF